MNSRANKSNFHLKLQLQGDITILKLELSVVLLATLQETFLISLTILTTKIETLKL